MAKTLVAFGGPANQNHLPDRKKLTPYQQQWKARYLHCSVSRRYDRQKNNLFGDEIHIVDRTCEVDNSVRTNTSSTGNFLREKFDMVFPGNLTITETFFTSEGEVSNT